jgi:hypothetical protein
MLGWIIVFAAFSGAIYLWIKIRNNKKVQKFTLNTKWLFGIFIFFAAFDVWTTYFSVLWLGFCYEANPLFGESLTLPMAIAVKIAQLLFIFFLLKYFSTKLNQKSFSSFCATMLIVIDIMMFTFMARMQYDFYVAVYNAVHAGFYLF